jgi:hypothetical protein
MNKIIATLIAGLFATAATTHNDHRAGDPGCRQS